MGFQSVEILRKVARYTRSIGLGRPLGALTTLGDLIFQKINYPPIKVYYEGLLFYGFLRHTRYLSLLSAGLHESYSIELFKGQITPGSIVVDGGAHIGLYSLVASRMFSTQLSIFSFEPDPYNYRVLKINLAKNHCDNVVAKQVALADKKGVVAFYQGKTTLSSSLLNRSDVEQSGVIKVQSNSLDNELSSVDVDNLVLKLDLEGAEPFAISGMLQILQKSSSVAMLIEVNPSALGNLQFKTSDIIDPLTELGFSMYIVDEQNHQIRLYDSRHNFYKDNLFCLKGRNLP